MSNSKTDQKINPHVDLVDPNIFSKNNTQLNLQMPKYEDMHIFVELTSYLRDRTVLNTTGIMTKIDDSGISFNDDNKRYNLLGSNSANQFTTNWYDGSTKSNGTNLEGFGIDSIKITTNTSFIPQVEIKFVDYRGRTFFNNDQSPYRMLFNFPPPIFKLTVKGYYGKALTYLLHLVKYTTEFKSDNGFFYIDASFVALTFAPLSDIPFRYVIQFQYLDNQTVNPDNNLPPENTNDLITKIKSLYSNLPNLIKNQNATDQLSRINTSNNYISKAFDFLSSNNIRDINNLNTHSIIFTLSSTKEIVIINSISNYNNQINLNDCGESVPTNVYNTLCVGYKYGGINYTNNNVFVGSIPTDIDSGNNTLLTNFINRFTEILVKANVKFDPLKININYGYIYVDLTNAYLSLSLKKQTNLNELQSVNAELTSVINSLILKKLGMLPTIYNIFNIILNDVDNFFKILLEYSKLAENHHRDYYNDIVSDGGYGDIKQKKIYSFPLIINDINKTRISPIEISNKLPAPFPEITLVNKFILSFPKLRFINEQNTLENKDTNGNNIWIPISPKDSSLNIDVMPNPFGSNISAIKYYEVSINRYYIFKDIIYSKSQTPSLLKTVAEGEATNLFNVIINQNDTFINNINSNVENWIAKPQSFYDYIKLNLPDLYNINSDIITTVNKDVYCTNKSNINYSGGFNIYNDEISIKSESFTNTSFWDTLKSYFNIFNVTPYIGDIKNNSAKFTKENVLCISDTKKDYTRYFDNGPEMGLLINNEHLSYYKKIAVTYGNIGFDYEINNNDIGYGDIKYARYTSKQVKIDHNIEILTQFSERFYTYISDYTGITGNSFEIINMALISSCFGTVTSPFNYINSKINSIFRIPAAIEIPKFVNFYTSVLAYLTSDSGINDLNIVTDFFINTDIKYGVTILADLYDMKNSLSDIDRNLFVSKYNYDSLMKDYKILNTSLYDFLSLTPNPTQDQFYNFFKTNTNYNDILFKKINFLNFDDQTFKLENKNNKINPKIISISEMIKSDPNSLNTYFSLYLKKINSLLTKKKNDDKAAKIAKTNLAGDLDLINQTYYSFKNINDKWLSEMGENINGYPFSPLGKKLIDSFVFVDRAMNPVGNTMINPEILGQLMESPDASILTVLSSLLSLNHFEFFPLQNFINPSKDWQTSLFDINNNTIVDSSPSFVCMYLGGSSSYPTGLEQYNLYKEDGILNLEDELDVKDTGGDSEQRKVNPNYPWGYVKGFKVRFGEQNQSVFNEIKIDSKEYTETNESLQILSQLAGDNNKVEPVPKAQNLYNVYENRAYKATVSGLGNALIQPSQYFQLENIPMFNGAYMILGVEHNISNNRMTTSFTGTKILKYPIPRVTDAATVFGYGGGDSTITSPTPLPNNTNNNINGTPLTTLTDTINGAHISPTISKIMYDPISGMSKVNSYTGFRTYHNSLHNGIDIRANAGTSVIAVADGYITSDTGGGIDAGYGYHIVIDHGTGYFNDQSIHLFSLYGHLRSLTEIKNPITKKSFNFGDKVSAGQTIGVSGNSGKSKDDNPMAYHLHFGLYQGSFKEPNAINPTNFFDPTTKMYILTVNQKNK